MIEKICKLLESEDPEVQSAAATVLGELQAKEEAVRKALHAALRAPAEVVKRTSLAALEKIGIEPSLGEVVALLGGPAVLKRRATEILLSRGEAAVKLLRDRLKKAAPEIRRGILDVLGQTGGDSAETFLESLLDEDFEVSRQATDTLIEKAKQLPDKERLALSKKVLSLLADPKARKNPHALVGAVKVLGYLGLPAAVAPLLNFVGSKIPQNVRTHALTALSHLDLAAKAKAVAAKVLPLLEEENYAEIGDRALKVLQRTEIGRDASTRLLKLLQKSPHPPVRIFAARALAQLGSPQAAGALLEALGSPDPALSEAAATAFRSNPALAPVLLKAFWKEKDPKKSWTMANLLRSCAKGLGKSAVKPLAKKCVEKVVEREPDFQIYFEILRAADPEALKAALLQQGRALLQKKKFDDAESCLRLLDREDLTSDEALFSLGVARLRTLRKDLSQAHRDRSHALALFSRLARKEGFPLVARLQKETSILTAEDYLYLGFCLAERMGVEREAGGMILKFVAKKYASKPEGKTAKQKISTQGLK